MFVRESKKHLLTVPNNLVEVHLALEEDVKIKQGELFILINNRENYVIIFSCETNI